MSRSAPVTVEIVHGAAGARRARSVRAEVFVGEQGIPAVLKWDGFDSEAWHALALDPTGEVVGTARLLPSGQIGRMAVLRAHRGRGAGGALLGALVALAERQGLPVFLHAQRSAVGFYLRHGFEPVGKPFMEAGIEHQRMAPAPGATVGLSSRDGREM